MKKNNLIKIRPIIFILCMLAAPSLFALDGISVQLGFGYNRDGANMGEFLTRGGLGYSDSMYITPTGQLIIPKKDLNKSSYVIDVEAEEAMGGINAALGLRFDFLNRFFIKIDGEFEQNIMGGFMEWEWNGYPNINPGDNSRQEFGYEAWSVPAVIGLNVPIKTKGKGKYNAYIGAGAAWGFSLVRFELDHPSGFVNGLNGFHEEIFLRNYPIGFVWTVGLSAEIAKKVFLFIEYREINYNLEVKKFTFKTPYLNAMNGNKPYILPVDFSSSIIRFGVLYNIISF